MDDEGKTGTVMIENPPEAPPPAKIGLPVPSTMRASRGRVVLVHSDQWKHGPYPALVTNDWNGAESVNLGPTADAANEKYQPKALTSVPLFDPLSDEERAALLEAGVRCWAEWMPFQKGQAVKTQAAEGFLARELLALVERVKALEERPVAVVQPSGTGSAQLPAKMPEAKIAAVPADEQPATPPRQPRSTNPVTGYTGPAVGKPDPARHDANR